MKLVLISTDLALKGNTYELCKIFLQLEIWGIAMHHAFHFQDELFSRIHSMRDSDEDMGLPHSPSTYPSTADVLAQGLKVITNPIYIFIECTEV